MRLQPASPAVRRRPARKPRLSQAAAIWSLARKGLLGVCLAGPACRLVLAEHHLMGSGTGELHLRPQAR
jgi:hypothetical protein